MSSEQDKSISKNGSIEVNEFHAVDEMITNLDLEERMTIDYQFLIPIHISTGGKELIEFVDKESQEKLITKEIEETDRITFKTAKEHFRGL